MSAQSIRVTQVRRDDLESTAATLAGRFQISGFAGSGYSLLTDAYGIEIFIEKELSDWSTSALFLMRQSLTSKQLEMLAAWGVPDADQIVPQLPFGHALLLERVGTL